MAAEKRTGTLNKIKRSALGFAFQSGLYNLSLGGSAPNNVLFTPCDSWHGDRSKGLELLDGIYDFAGTKIPMQDPIWQPFDADDHWVCEFNSFEWLRDLRSVGGDAARKQARLLLQNWIEKNQHWQADLWSGKALTKRIGAWLSLYDFYGSSADDQFQKSVLHSLTRQARHLSRIFPNQLPVDTRISALKALIFSDICLNSDDNFHQTALAHFEQIIDQSIYPDGSPKSRNPADLLWFLRDLIDIRAILKMADREIPEALHFAIDKMTPALKFFLHGDGKLAHFNGGQEDQPDLIATIIAHSDARGTPLKDLPHSRYARVQAGKSLLLADVGFPANSNHDLHAHASTLSFEFSKGKERLIVNCGSHKHLDKWHQALGATAAHSTVCLADVNSSQLLVGGGISRLPNTISYDRLEQEGATLLQGAHDGYQPNFETDHERRLFLSADGEDLRGEDALIGPSNIEFAVRFHLHPNVGASLTQDGQAILLKMPSGEGWRFKTKGFVLDLEESIYIDPADTIRQSQQIVIRGTTRSSKTICKWSLKREKIEKKEQKDS